MSLLDKLRKNSKIAEATTLEASTILDIPFEVSTLVIAINVALSGNPNGGLTPGMIQVAGPSKHFKTNFSLVMCAAYMKKFKDAVMIFYDSEFGASKRYFKAAGIDPNRVLHCPIKDIEQLKQDLSNQLKELSRKDDVIIFIDSVGNLASRKEVEDAINEKAVADMSRAKALKSLWRIVTPELTMKAIPLIAVNHTYKEIGMFPKDIVGGGCVMAGTEVKMADGTLKAIETIQVGELVQTHIGDKQVTHTWNPETLIDGTPEVYEFTFEDGSKIKCSENHRFLTADGWKYVSELSPNDDLLKM